MVPNYDKEFGLGELRAYGLAVPAPQLRPQKALIKKRCNRDASKGKLSQLQWHVVLGARGPATVNFGFRVYKTLNPKP